MTLAALAFAAGAAALQQRAELPALGSVGLLPLLAGLAWLRPKWAFIFTFGIGFLWAAGWAHWRMTDRLAPELEGRDLDVVGVVASLPAIGDRGLRFEFDVESVEGGARLPARLLVSWYRSPSYEDAPATLSDSVHPGERWLFTLRLRRPHGLVNPHGFDYEAWLLERGIGATGSSRRSARRLPREFSPRWRSATSAPFRARNGSSSTAPASRT